LDNEVLIENNLDSFDNFFDEQYKNLAVKNVFRNRLLATYDVNSCILNIKNNLKLFIYINKHTLISN
jgi:hypothetical protein